MSSMTCPGCGAAAEITERFTLASTDGPVVHVALSCAGGHHYRMAADKLPASTFGPPPRVIPVRPCRMPSRCDHCLANPAGFWVSDEQQRGAPPWCLSCCETMDSRLLRLIPDRSCLSSGDARRRRGAQSVAAWPAAPSLEA